MKEKKKPPSADAPQNQMQAAYDFAFILEMFNNIV